ncbi:MAG: hypothetical protein EI684_05310 [Candidatus Viridilinea halotolerans]|uniref:C2H2-type domain-containing protein n=1 Tax=Candidatus Viridilinea halotolerans TaxID=2491704 RepID=A0A426U5M6_9CHLR|nr:MAG: hypothetical protein EI684_05310 [Candidatus Viridilinea halotolerans]
MAITTIKPDGQSVNPLAALNLDPEQLATPTAQRARLSGLLDAKREAHQSAARLARWARPLSIAVVLTSGLHIWETLAAVAPPSVAALSLPGWAYHLSALLLVLMIDCSIVFLAAATSAAAYAGHNHRSAALPLLYTATGLLNLAYLARYMPGLPDALQGPVLSLLAIVFVLLLSTLVPVVLVAIERAGHILTVSRLALGVEVATLRGLVEADNIPVAAQESRAEELLCHANATPAAEAYLRELPAQQSYPAPESVTRQPVSAIAEPETASLVAGNTSNVPVAIYRCRHCGVEGITKAEQLAHGRRHATERRNRHTQEENTE